MFQFVYSTSAFLVLVYALVRVKGLEGLYIGLYILIIGFDYIKYILTCHADKTTSDELVEESLASKGLLLRGEGLKHDVILALVLVKS